MRLAASAAAVLTLATPAVGLPQGVKNARVETRSAASGLAAVVKAELASRPGPLWIGWSVETRGGHSACCWSSGDLDVPRCRGCRLEGSDTSFGTDGDEPARLEGSGRVRLLLRAEGGRVGRIRVVSEGCPLDAGGLPFVWIEGVRPAESIALLATYVGEPRQGSESGKRLDGEVTMAVALHADPAADAALERFVAPGQPLELRKQAAFWMGQARGARGYEVLKRLVREDPERRLREHAIFALSQSDEPGAVDDDPEIGVKKKAVFALSQLPKDEGVPLLVSLARTHQSHEVRKQAMFWLGQSGDPRALAFFEDVLRP